MRTQESCKNEVPDAIIEEYKEAYRAWLKSPCNPRLIEKLAEAGDRAKAYAVVTDTSLHLWSIDVLAAKWQAAS